MSAEGEGGGGLPSNHLEFLLIGDVLRGAFNAWCEKPLLHLQADIFPSLHCRFCDYVLIVFIAFKFDLIWRPH